MSYSVTIIVMIYTILTQPYWLVLKNLRVVNMNHLGKGFAHKSEVFVTGCISEFTKLL